MVDAPASYLYSLYILFPLENALLKSLCHIVVRCEVKLVQQNAQEIQLQRAAYRKIYFRMQFKL